MITVIVWTSHCAFKKTAMEGLTASDLFDEFHSNEELVLWKNENGRLSRGGRVTSPMEKIRGTEKDFIKVRVNGVKSSLDYLVKDGDLISFTPSWMWVD